MGDSNRDRTPLDTNISATKSNNNDILNEVVMDSSNPQTTTETIGRPADKELPEKTKEIRLFNVASDKYNYPNVHVYIEKINNQNLGQLHPLAIGHILHKILKIPNIIEIRSIGRNRIKVELRTLNDANNLVQNPNLVVENLRAYIPNHLLEIKGVIRDVDTQFDIDLFTAKYRVSLKVLNIQRLHRKDEVDGNITYKPRQMIVVTFEGNKLPNHFSINRVFLQ
ncbi:hypothetical protein JTB14_027876 [Gonioctena quinquepunctata]|nr:hypothetical protein JTB14_027876 [Gonioctena quinquepunctata]